MHKTDAANNVANEFSDGTPPLTPGTSLGAKWHNTIQRELVAVVEGAGLALDDNDDSQVFQSLDLMYGRPDAWTAITLNSGGNWANAFGDETTQYQPKYRKDTLGRVWLRGRAARTAGNNSTIGTLPVGVRPSPSAGMFFPVVGQGGSVLGAIQVAGNGSIVWVVGDPGGASDVNLDGVMFYAGT